MRLALFVLCLTFGFAGNAASQASPVPNNYHRVSAQLETLSCGDPDSHADCVMYFKGFAHTIGMILDKGLCGDVDDLLPEFVQESRIHPTTETHALLFQLLAKNHNCKNGEAPFQNYLSAGYLIDMCHVGDVGFQLCSDYRWGFISAMLFMSEQTGKHLLCGNPAMLDNAEVFLNDKLQTNYRLRQERAVKVMFDEMLDHMPCQHASPPAEVTKLIAEDETLNDKCRNDPNAVQACSARDGVLAKLKELGWCWGHDGQVEADKKWEACTIPPVGVKAPNIVLK